MRLGVLDVGSNTVHLLVVDARAGGRPEAVASSKDELRLAELLQADGSLGDAGTALLVRAVDRAARAARREGVAELLAFATSAVRDATDSAAVLARVRDETGVDLQVLPGEDEARLTFLAVRRWSGWSAGRLLCLDIGGGSLELGVGDDEVPEIAYSLPLGAGRLTRERLPDDPPRRKQLSALREHVEAELATVAPVLLAGGPPDHGVGTSKTFRTLAALDGGRLSRRGVGGLVELLAGMPASERVRLPGVSPARAHQLLAGAVVAHVAMTALELDAVDVCPWALREGVVLRRLDLLAAT